MSDVTPTSHYRINQGAMWSPPSVYSVPATATTPGTERFRDYDQLPAPHDGHNYYTTPGKPPPAYERLPENGHVYKSQAQLQYDKMLCQAAAYRHSDKWEHICSGSRGSASDVGRASDLGSVAGSQSRASKQGGMDNGRADRRSRSTDAVQKRSRSTDAMQKSRRQQQRPASSDRYARRSRGSDTGRRRSA